MSKSQANDMVRVIVPNNIFGPAETYKNHDPKRIQNVEVQYQQVILHMTLQNYMYSLQEFVHYLAIFQQEVLTNRHDEQFNAYERVEYVNDYQIIRFYLTAEQYVQHLF